MDDLLINGLGELFGIVVTVFIVDRLLVWHSNRPWRLVQRLFQMHSKLACDLLMGARSKWIRSFETEPAPLSDVNANKVKPELQRFLGSRIASGMGPFLYMFDETSAEQLVDMPVAWCAECIREGTEPPVQQVVTDVERGVRKIDPLVTQYSRIAALDPSL